MFSSDRTRVNERTGVFEEDRGLFGPDWQPIRNASGRAERLNMKTRQIEENRGWLSAQWKPLDRR